MFASIALAVSSFLLICFLLFLCLPERTYIVKMDGKRWRVTMLTPFDTYYEEIPFGEEPMKKNHDIVDIDAELRHETEKAFLIYDGKKEVWLPKVQVQNNNDGSFSMPEWLAIRHGLI